MTQDAPDKKRRPASGGFFDDIAERLWDQTVLGKTPPARATSGRFHKGHSGNPRGRPRKNVSEPVGPWDDSLTGLVLSEACRSITVREGETTRQMSAEQAMIRSEINQAIKGDPRAQRNGLARIERARQREAEVIAREQANWRFYKDQTRNQIASAKAKGEPEPQILPHPDDIVIEPGKRVRFIGPLNEEELEKARHNQRVRDHLIEQDALDTKMWAGPRPQEFKDGPGAASVLSMLVDETLPPRMRLTTGERMYKERLAECTSKRVLLKKVYRGWRELGFPDIRRGVQFPIVKSLIGTLEISKEIFQGLNEGRLDLDTLDSPAWRQLFDKYSITS